MKEFGKGIDTITHCPGGRDAHACECEPGGCTEAKPDPVGKVVIVEGHGIDSGMSMERALEINDHMCGIYFYSVGLKVPTIVDLRGMIEFLRNLSLKDMLEAKELVEKHPGEPVTMPSGKTGRTCNATCADRFIAALYAGLHHEGDQVLVRTLTSCLASHHMEAKVDA